MLRNIGAQHEDASVTNDYSDTLLAVELLYRKHGSLSRRGTIALWLLLGIWMFGPLCTTIGATFAGGGFTYDEYLRRNTVCVGPSDDVVFDLRGYQLRASSGVAAGAVKTVICT
jgi:hypothetical protein